MMKEQNFSDVCLDSIRNAAPILEETIKRGLTNAAIQRTRWPLEHPKELYSLDDVSFAVDGNTNVCLSEMRLVGAPDMRVTSVRCHLEAMTLPLTLRLGRVRLQGCYEATNSALARILPISSKGTLTITLEDMKAKGVVGLNISGDSFVPIVYDLDFSIQEVCVRVEYPGQAEDTINELTYSDVDNSIVKKIWKTLTFTLNGLITDQLNQVLSEISIMDLLESDSDVIQEIEDHSRNLTTTANNIVDVLLQKSRTIVGEQIIVGSTDASFCRKSLRGRRQWGGFYASGGWLGNLHSLRRKCNASFIHSSQNDVNSSSNALYVYALLELTELKLIYENYKVHFPNTMVKGKVTMSMGVNTWLLIVQLLPDVSHCCDVDIKQFKYLYSRPTEIDVTGLGSLNSLIPNIATWTMGTFLEREVTKIEQNEAKALRKVSQKIRFSPIKL